MPYLASEESLSSSGMHEPPQTAPGGQDNSSLRRRRGATAMEYLFVISLILVALITTIGSFGQTTKHTTTDASKAIQKATKLP
jgi:Flp pilus assembly pilin Flp